MPNYVFIQCNFICVLSDVVIKTVNWTNEWSVTLRGAWRQITDFRGSLLYTTVSAVNDRYCLTHWSEVSQRVLEAWYKRCGFCAPNLPQFDELQEDADSTVFSKNHHRQRQLSTAVTSSINFYRHFRRLHNITSLRDQTHQFHLPDRTGRLADCNFLVRSLYKDVYWLVIIN